jgi:hypothetical protein
VTCLAAIAVFLFPAAPLLATESDVKPAPAKTAKPAAEAAGEEQKAKPETPPNLGTCSDTEAGPMAGVNTLEDIFALSGGDVAAMLKLAAEPAAQVKPAEEGVRWTEAEAKAESARPASVQDED